MVWDVLVLAWQYASVTCFISHYILLLYIEILGCWNGQPCGAFRDPSPTCRVRHRARITCWRINLLEETHPETGRETCKKAHIIQESNLWPVCWGERVLSSEVKLADNQVLCFLWLCLLTALGRNRHLQIYRIERHKDGASFQYISDHKWAHMWRPH